MDSTNKPAFPATFEEVRRQQLRDGIALSTRAKVEFFEEMVTLALRFGARDRLRTSVAGGQPRGA